ncbi:MAG: hotdog fold thioesterase [Bacteroidota bacterium]
MDKISIEEINALNKGTMMEHLHIEYIEVEKGRLVARMPVNHTTFQPDKILHGGATIALAETVAGLGSAYLVDNEKYAVRGAQVSANHIRSIRNGYVLATGSIIYKGSNMHVWNIDITDERNSIISTCRITNIITKK